MLRPTLIPQLFFPSTSPTLTQDPYQASKYNKRYKQCARVVKEVLNEPSHVILLRYLEKCRKRMRLKLKTQTFLNQNPRLFMPLTEAAKVEEVVVAATRGICE